MERLGRTGSWTLAILTVIGGATVSTAQGGSGGPSLSGRWLLDADLSDNPEQVARALRLDTGESATDEALGGLGGGRGGYGRGGYGRGGYGRGGPAGGGSAPRRPEAISAEDRKLLKELTDAVQFPPPGLTITQSGTDVTIAGGSGPAQTFHANGKAEKQQLEAGVVDRTAAWEGPRFAVRYEVAHAGTLKYTYSVAQITKQLVVRVTFDREQQAGPFEIKLVYDPAPSSGS